MLSILLKTLKYLILLTLPLTIFPLLTGIFGGILFPIFHNNHINYTVEKYLENVKHTVSDWGVGGGVQSFNQFQDKNNRFHLVRMNSDDWLQKLGYILPIEYSDPNIILHDDVPIDKQADLPTLMQPITVKGHPKEQWLFLTGLEWLDWIGWNAAFDDLLQYAYTDAKLNNNATVKFHFAECSSTASFLCNVWNTRSPALVHFLVDDSPLSEEEIDVDLHYKIAYRHLLPVQVRIIELGLQEAYTGLPWTTFPSKEKQLRAIVAGDRMYEQFEPYGNGMDLLFVRFNEYMDRLFDARGTVLNHFNEMDWWWGRNVIDPLGLDDFTMTVHSATFQVAIVVSTLVDFVAVRPVRWLWNEFLGTPKPGDIMFADMEFEDEEPEGDDLGDIFGFNQMFQSFSAKAEKESSEAARTAAGETSVPPETTQSGPATKL